MDDTPQQNPAAPSEARQSHAWALLYEEYHNALLETPDALVSTPGCERESMPLSLLLWHVLGAHVQAGDFTTLHTILQVVSNAAQRRSPSAHDFIEELAAELCAWQVKLLADKGAL